MDKIEKLRSFLINAPDDAFLNHALALEYIKRGDSSAAKQLFISILTRDPFYIGSYYHLAQLLEQTSEIQEAKSWYEKGIAAATVVQDKHALNELRAAYEAMED